MFKRMILALTAATLLALPTAGRAQTLTSLGDIADITVLPGWRTADGTHMAAIRISLAKGWKTYWRSPGDAGIPPRFDWEGSDNLAAVKFFWPAPNVFYTNGLRSIGYKDVTIIPIELTPGQAADGKIALRGQMELGVCEDICIPMAVELSADLDATGDIDATIRAGLKKLPLTAAAAGVKSATCKIEPMDDGLRLTATIEVPRQGKDEVAVVELPDQSIWIAETETSRDGRLLMAATELVPPAGKPFMLERSDIRITVLGDGRAIDIQGCAAS